MRRGKEKQRKKEKDHTRERTGKEERERKGKHLQRRDGEGQSESRGREDEIGKPSKSSSLAHMETCCSQTLSARGHRSPTQCRWRVSAEAWKSCSETSAYLQKAGSVRRPRAQEEEMSVQRMASRTAVSWGQ